MQIDRHGFLKTGAIVPAAVLAGCGEGGSADTSAEVSGLATVNGQKLYYVILGTGTPVIFMHGSLGFDHQYFRPYVDPLADSAKVVCYAQLGQGKSDRPAYFNA